MSLSNYQDSPETSLLESVISAKISCSTLAAIFPEAKNMKLVYSKE